jgi:hypothetical protein
MMTKVVDYSILLLVFSHEQIQSGSKYWKFLQKTIRPHPCFDEKNSYVGYYEIDDIMSFSPDSILERTRKNNKGKKGIGIIQ